MTEFLIIVIGAALANNFVLVQFLGVTGALALPVTNQLRPSLFVALASAALIVISATVNYLSYHLVLLPSGTQYLRLVAFMLTATVLLGLLAAAWQRIHSASFDQIRGSLLLVAVNTCILGTTILSIDQQDSFATAIGQALGAATGFALVLIVLSAIQIRLHHTRVPQPFRGPAIALISTGLLALGFLGFAGIV